LVYNKNILVRLFSTADIFLNEANVDRDRRNALKMWALNTSLQITEGEVVGKATENTRENNKKR